jgi:phage tail-like protein
LSGDATGEEDRGMAPPAHDDDPYKGYSFRVEIEGLQSSAFREVSGLAAETAVIEYRVGTDPVGHVRKLPGLTRHPNLVLRRGVTQNRELWEWHARIRNGEADRRDGAVFLLDDTGVEVVRWNFFHGWVAKIEGPELNATANEVAIETVEIAHDRLELA